VRRTLGSTGIETAPLAFGGNVFGWTIDEAQSFRMLDAFVDTGFNLIDTADVYSRWVPGNPGGVSEAIIGRWLAARGCRHKVHIATKVGMEVAPGVRGLRRARVEAAIEGSLRRLQTDYADLYFAHQDDPETPLQETLEAFERLREAGKIRFAAASNIRAERLEAANHIARTGGWSGFQVMQPLYNLHDRDAYEGPLETLCSAEGLGVITYSSLASGFLTGKYRSIEDVRRSARSKALATYLTPRGEAVLAALASVAAALDVPPATAALAWVLARPGVSAAIVSATTPTQWNELVAATELRLDADSLAQLNAC
jgi:aryl-alcohol dehydrogenase-like predicted oxidoreductase